MRTDPLVPAKTVPIILGKLPTRDFPSEIIDLNTEWMDRIAELIPGILNSEDDQEFESGLARLNETNRFKLLDSTFDLLGIYDPNEEKIILDKDKIQMCAESMKSQQTIIHETDLMEVVRIHENFHASQHLAIDSLNNDEIWNEFPYTDPSLLEMLAQLFTYFEVEQNSRLLEVFFALEKRQPLVYRLWRLFKYTQKEQIYWSIRTDLRVQQIFEKLGFITPKRTVSPIKLRELFNIVDPSNYKLHLACKSGETQPLDEYVADESIWHGWNAWKGNKNDWTRDYIFSLIEFYPRRDSWLFGGIFKVISRDKEAYEIEKVKTFEQYEGRLIVSFHRYQGLRRRDYNLTTFLDQFDVTEILAQPYSGEEFPGYENINHDFHILEAIFRYERLDWKGALSNVKGVYLICDKSNGKKYVGSAYGTMGIWSRWSCYIGTGHGWNDELTKLVDKKGIEYARKKLPVFNFRNNVHDHVRRIYNK